MSIKFKTIVFASFISFIIVGCSNSNLIELTDNVSLKKVNQENFELIFDKGTEDEWIYTNVDSLSSLEEYSFLFYGIRRNDSEKKWHYVTGYLEFKKGYGNWYDGEFRKYRLKELYNGDQLYENLKSTEQIWNKKAHDITKLRYSSN